MTAAAGLNTVCENGVLGTPQGSSLGSCSGTAAGTTTYSAGTYKVCDGTTWYDMKGSSLGSCAGTAAGTLSYASNAFKFCDGTTWYSFTSSASIPCSETLHGSNTMSSYIDMTWGPISAGGCPYPTEYQFQDLGTQNTEKGSQDLFRCGKCGPGSTTSPANCLNNSNCVAH